MMAGEKPGVNGSLQKPTNTVEAASTREAQWNSFVCWCLNTASSAEGLALCL